MPYGLKIPDNELEVLAHFLGIGEMKNVRYWYIGNEEALFEAPIKTGEHYNNGNERYNYFNLINDQVYIGQPFFYKKIDTIPFGYKPYITGGIDDNIHWVYKQLLDKNPYGIKNLSQVFLGEFYFLPIDSGSSGENLSKKYGGKKLPVHDNNKGGYYTTRADFYKLNGLEPLLKERLKSYKNILSDITHPIKVIFYGESTHKVGLINEIFDENWKNIYTHHSITIIPFDYNNLKDASKK